MVHFTNSPFEYMMTQKPRQIHENKTAHDFSKKQCIDCPYGRNRPCIGVCMKELLTKRKGKKQ